MYGECEILDAQAAAVAPARQIDEKELSPLDYNDIGNAARLVARFGGDLRYVEERGWAAFDGRRWDLERGRREAEKRARETAQAIQEAEYRAILDAGPQPFDTVKPDFTGIENDPDRKQKAIDAAERATKAKLRARAGNHKKWGVACGNRAKMSAMLDCAQTDLYCLTEELDRAPMKFNCRTGTILLGPRLRLRAHDRRDLITKCADVDYDPGAECPLWEAHMARCLPDRSVRDFTQRFLGYCLTGSIAEQVMCVWLGSGANGKSTTVNVLRRILGDYTSTAKVETFLAPDRHKSGAEASPDLARLPGARLVSVSEPEKGAKLSESGVKQVTGGEPILARRLREEFFEFYPAFKLILSCNDRPIIRGNDEGIWRRVLLVPWEVSIPKEERDPGMEDKLAGEASGILNWLLDGFSMWRESGLQPPEAVRAATQDYRIESDPLHEFFQTECVFGEGYSIAFAELYTAYESWCEAGKVKAVTSQFFARRLTELGCAADRNMKSRLRLGVDLKVNHPGADDALPPSSPLEISSAEAL
ncbi:MAG: phage/plasmid primase, P4 family [Parvularculaceae bacterium]